jgi:hypothetical protein
MSASHLCTSGLRCSDNTTPSLQKADPFQTANERTVVNMISGPKKTIIATAWNVSGV